MIPGIIAENMTTINVICESNGSIKSTTCMYDIVKNWIPEAAKWSVVMPNIVSK